VIKKASGKSGSFIKVQRNTLAALLSTYLGNFYTHISLTHYRILDFASLKVLLQKEIENKYLKRE
jgi:hypothetical protein